MEILIASSICVLAMVSFKFFTRKKRVPELAFPDATDVHLSQYSDEYIRTMNERYKAWQDKQAV